MAAQLAASQEELSSVSDISVDIATGYKIPIFFLFRIVGGGVQLGPLGTAATNRPIVKAPGDDDGKIY
jgi:hypothetical protein